MKPRTHQIDLVPADGQVSLFRPYVVSAVRPILPSYDRDEPKPEWPKTNPMPKLATLLVPLHLKKGTVTAVLKLDRAELAELLGLLHAAADFMDEPYATEEDEA